MLRTVVRYRRDPIPGGIDAFTVALADRRSTLLTTSIDALRAAFRNAIVDHLDEVHGHDDIRLIPTSGEDRRAVLKHPAIAMGACDKGLQAAYERNHHLPEKLHQPWIDDCRAQVASALSYIREQIVPGQAHLLLGRLTQADISAFVAERLGPAYRATLLALA